MFLTKLKLGTAAVLCAGLFVALIGGSFASLVITQEANAQEAFQGNGRILWEKKAESDADFIRRISRDLRGTDPTPAEVHFFVASKDAGRRQKLIDLFIQERQAKKAAAEPAVFVPDDVRIEVAFRPDAGGAGLLNAGDDANEEAVKRELTKMDGTWQILSLVVEGKNLLAKDDSKKRSFVIKRGTLTTVGTEKNAMEAALKINPSKSPREIDIIFTAGPTKGETRRGVYKLEGDYLTICYARADGDRPSDFTSKPESGKALIVYKRQKP